MYKFIWFGVDIFVELTRFYKIIAYYVMYSAQSILTYPRFYAAGMVVSVVDQPRSFRQSANYFAEPKARCLFLSEEMRLYHRLVLV